MARHLTLEGTKGVGGGDMPVPGGGGHCPAKTDHRAALRSEAVRRDPNNLDAIMIIVRYLPTRAAALKMLEAAEETGRNFLKQKFGAQVFETPVANFFWGVLMTRPKMSVQVLRICPEDSFGQHVPLSAVLARLGRYSDALSLCGVVHTAALSAFKLWGGCPESQQYLELAVRINPLILFKILGRISIPKRPSGQMRIDNGPEDAQTYLWRLQDMWMESDVWAWANSNANVILCVRRICNGCEKAESDVAAFKRCAQCHLVISQSRLGQISAANYSQQVSYCGAACQKADWPEHKLACLEHNRQKASIRAFGEKLPKRRRQPRRRLQDLEIHPVQNSDLSPLGAGSRRIARTLPRYPACDTYLSSSPLSLSSTRLTPVHAGVSPITLSRRDGSTQTRTFALESSPTALTQAAVSSAYSVYTEQCGSRLDSKAYSALPAFTDAAGSPDAKITDDGFRSWMNQVMPDWNEDCTNANLKLEEIEGDNEETMKTTAPPTTATPQPTDTPSHSDPTGDDPSDTFSYSGCIPPLTGFPSGFPSGFPGGTDFPGFPGPTVALEQTDSCSATGMSAPVSQNSKPNGRPVEWVPVVDRRGRDELLIPLSGRVLMFLLRHAVYTISQAREENTVYVKTFFQRTEFFKQRTPLTQHRQPVEQELSGWRPSFSKITEMVEISIQRRMDNRYAQPVFVAGKE
ncbi:hypothetical protein C8R43DRAFT_964238 [Mycena crocata]|nr:hypothetical protein C8R43DRAFT_964238 [Mycena crocata]